MANICNWFIHLIEIRRIWVIYSSRWVLSSQHEIDTDVGASELISFDFFLHHSLIKIYLFFSQISCTIKSTPSRSRNIPIIVRVSDVNDEPPVFVNTPYETSIAEVSLTDKCEINLFIQGCLGFIKFMSHWSVCKADWEACNYFLLKPSWGIDGCLQLFVYKLFSNLAGNFNGNFWGRPQMM